MNKPDLKIVPIPRGQQLWKPITHQQRKEYEKARIYEGHRPRSAIPESNPTWPVSISDRLRHLTNRLQRWFNAS